MLSQTHVCICFCLIVQVCQCTDPQASLVPEHVWQQLLTAAARLHNSDLATDILRCMLQQQRQQSHLAACGTHQHAAAVLQHTLADSSRAQQAAAGVTTASNLAASATGSSMSASSQPLSSHQQLAHACRFITKAVKLSLDLGLLHCCPSVAFTLWQIWQEWLQECKPDSGAALVLESALSDDVLQQLILAAIRSSATQPEAASKLVFHTACVPHMLWFRLHDLATCTASRPQLVSICCCQIQALTAYHH